jgi:predicted nucleic acid-binding protein
MKLILDTNVLGRLSNPKAAQSGPVIERIERARAATSGLSVYIPEIADYELRRKLLHLRSKHSLRRLDALLGQLTYLRLDTPAMRRAADLWADARRQGHATAGDERLDADVILAAQALGIGGTVATTNVRHLSRYVAVEDWT